ncbi:MAG TPA: VCBS repeat-containing protein, partial [Casimicrobiaceae bacterium]
MRLDRGPIRSRADASHPGFVLRDGTKAAGITFVHSRPTFDSKIANVEPHVAALGAAVSVGDFDGDGWPDLYFTNSRFGAPNALYHNKRDGTFEDIAAKAGLAELNRPGDGVSMGSVWGDFDNDGREDLLVYRYGYLALYRNVDGTHFQDVTEAAGLHRWVNSNGAIWLDYDRDGLLDLYVTAYFRSDVDLWHLATTRIMHNSFEFATNGGKNLLFHNLGNGKFEDVTDKMGVGGNRWTLAAASADFNGDGWPDIYVANDYGPEELYLNDHGNRFTLTTAGLESESKSGMSVALGDAFNRGRLDAFVTNISERGYLFQNNNLRVNQMSDAHRFRNVAEGAIADAGWAWGAQFGDLNNDGANELFVANGFISADRGKSYWYAMSKIAGANGKLFEDAASWPAFGNASLSGYERSRVYINRGVAGWIDVAQTVGATDEYDGRAVALADLSNR